jgi:hypothetical protein
VHSKSHIVGQTTHPSTPVDPEAALFDFDRDMMSSSRSTIRNRGRRFFNLPLYNDAEYIRGLTLYQTGNGIIGLEAHFTETSQLSGYRDGCALYFLLCPNEWIGYAWLRILDFSSIIWAAPALIVSSYWSSLLVIADLSPRFKRLKVEVSLLGHSFDQT